MNSLSARIKTRLDNLIGEQITLGRWRFANVDCLIRKLHMQGFTICIGIHRDRFDAHLLRRLNDAAGNFTAVSY
jgi:hypothetical protein